MHETVDGGGGRHLVAEDAIPLSEDEIAGEQDRAPLIALGQ